MWLHSEGLLVDSTKVVVALMLVASLDVESTPKGYQT